MIARRVSVVIVGLLIGFIFGEIALRIVSPVKPGDLLPLNYDKAGLDRIAAGTTYIGFNQSLGWTIAPGSTGETVQATYRSNSAGMRSDREYTITPPETGPRLAAFGDSFTHCDDVNNDECWTAQLEEDVP